MLSWIEKNPTYAYRIFDDEDIEEYVASNFEQKHLETLHMFKQPVSKVDFWRLLFVLHDGGAYFDSDSGCVDPLDEWVDSQATYVTGIGFFKEFHQWGIVAAPGNAFLQQAVDDVMANAQKLKATGKWDEIKWQGLVVTKEDSSGFHGSLEKDKVEALGSGVENVAGPSVLNLAVDKCFMDPTCLAKTLPGLHVCPSDHFGGHARMKTGPYASTWKWDLPVLNFHESQNDNNATEKKACRQLILDK